MPTLLEHKVTRIKELFEQRESIDQEIAEMFGLAFKEEEVVTTTSKRKKRKQTTCTICGKTGHTKKHAHRKPKMSHTR